MRFMQIESVLQTINRSEPAKNRFSVALNPTHQSVQEIGKLFWSKFDIQSAGVTLKMRSRSSKSNHFFPMSHWCFCVSLVKIHQLFQDRVQKMLIFTVFIVW